MINITVSGVVPSSIRIIAKPHSIKSAVDIALRENINNPIPFFISQDDVVKVIVYKGIVYESQPK